MPKPATFLGCGILAWGVVIMAGVFAGQAATILGGILGACLFVLLTAVLTLDL